MLLTLPTIKISLQIFQYQWKLLTIKKWGLTNCHDCKLISFLHCSSAMFTGCSYFIIDLASLEKTNKFLEEHNSMLHTSAYYFFILDVTQKENARIQSWSLFKNQFFTKENFDLSLTQICKLFITGFKCSPLSTSV